MDWTASGVSVGVHSIQFEVSPLVTLWLALLEGSLALSLVTKRGSAFIFFASMASYLIQKFLHDRLNLW